MGEFDDEASTSLMTCTQPAAGCREAPAHGACQQQRYPSTVPSNLSGIEEFTGGEMITRWRFRAWSNLKITTFQLIGSSQASFVDFPRSQKATVWYSRTEILSLPDEQLRLCCEPRAECTLYIHSSDHRLAQNSAGPRVASVVDTDRRARNGL